MKLKLFALRDLQTGRVVPNLFFSDKKSAKAKRIAMGEARYCVTYGPDHRHHKG